jgi:hypothetical protein
MVPEVPMDIMHWVYFSQILHKDIHIYITVGGFITFPPI